MAKKSRKARKQVKQNELKSMTQKQYETILKLKKYAVHIGKECKFEMIPNSNNMLKYVEDFVSEETGLEYKFSIYVRNDGSVLTMCYTSIDIVEESDKENIEEYIRLLEEKSTSVSYAFDENGSDMIFISIDYDLEAKEYLQENFEQCVFEYVRWAFEYCIEGMAALLEKKMTLDEAVEYVLDEGETYNKKLKRVRYAFEHVILCHMLLTDSKCLKLLKKKKEEFLFDLMCKICDEEHFEIPYEINEFEMKTEKYLEYEMIRIRMPKPVQENNCLEIILVVGKDEVRYFTVEIGNEGKNLFVCEWTLYEDGKTMHHNYKMLKASSKGYIAEIKKCL